MCLKYNRAIIAARIESASRPSPALIARRRRTTLGVGILMTLAGPLRIPDGRRRVADLGLIFRSRWNLAAVRFVTRGIHS